MLRYSSILLCFSVVALVALGLIMLASTGVWVHNVDDPYHFLKRQAYMAAAGLVLAAILVWTPQEFLRRTYPVQMLAAVIALGLCFMPGVGEEIFGSKRWIKLPGLPQVQPSEFAKLAVIIALSAWYARWQTEVRTFFRGFLLPGAIVGIPVVLIMMQTDVGTAVSLAAAIGAVMFCVGAKLIYLLPTALTAVGAASYFVYTNANRWNRIQAWLDLDNPEHVLGTNMQQIRALYALGNGGVWGVGLGNGTEKFGTLSLAHMDFIFPVIGEELGLVCTLAVVICYVFITLGGIGIAMSATTVFNRCLALGLTCVLVIPAIINIGVTTAVLPNDGLPLPFVGYGGTNLVFSLAAVGLLVGIHRRSRPAAEAAFPLHPETRLAIRL